LITLAARLGYDAIELLGEPDAHPAADLRRLLHDHGLKVSALTAAARLVTERDLSHPRESVRRRAVDHLRTCVDYAAEIGAPIVGVAVTAVGRYWLEDEPAKERQWAVEGLATLAEHAQGADVGLAIEVLNRYSSCLANTPAQAAELARAADPSVVGVGLDLFHLCTEVRDPVAELRDCPALLNVQVAEHNREAPYGADSYAHRALTELARLDYPGAVALEAFPYGTRPYESVDSHLRDTSLAFLADFPPYVRSIVAAADREERS
jgi:sugar phosphate isomerase/epimerase